MRVHRPDLLSDLFGPVPRGWLALGTLCAGALARWSRGRRTVLPAS